MKNMLKFINKNNRKRSESGSKLTIKTAERCQWRRSGVFIFNFQHFSQLFKWFYWWLWTGQYLLGTRIKKMKPNASSHRRPGQETRLNGINKRSSRKYAVKQTPKTSLNPLSVSPTKWWNILEQFVGNLPTNCLCLTILRGWRLTG